MPYAEIWPDNLAAVNVFVSMSTQWRVGMGGAYGLDYAALPAVLEMLAVPRELWPETLEAIRVCEESALETMRAHKNG